MLHLPNVAVMILTADDAKVSTAAALKKTLRHINPGQVVLFTDELSVYNECVSDYHGAVSCVKVKPFESYEHAGIWLMRDFCRTEVFKTSHILSVHWDGFVLNEDAWTDEFLQYDWIGAAWPDGVVGNGGFHIRSKRFNAAVAELNLPPTLEACFPDDALCCRYEYRGKTAYRALLESKGIRFAPPELARRFSVENERYAGSFGFHGVHTLGSVIRQGEVTIG